MDSINLMIEEHKYIKRMLVVARKASYEIVKTGVVNYEDFENIIEFVRKYADAHHHGKEEKLLFNRMIDEVGGVAETLVKFGMLVEHDLGRLYMSDLEEALEKVKNGDEEAKVDVIGSTISYTNLLQRHINKEDNVVYTFARRQLSKATLEKINEECEQFEAEGHKEKIQEKYIFLLEKLERKYN